MESVAKALLTATEEVFITDWWLSPEIMMFRPTDDETFRLDNLLGKIAVREREINERLLYSKYLLSGRWSTCLCTRVQRNVICNGSQQSTYETSFNRQEQKRFY